MQGVKFGKMIIKKRFGKRNFVQYLGLQNDDYALVPKKKKKKTEYIPGVSVTYRNDPGSQAELEAQQMANSVRFIPHRFEDQRAYRYTAKTLPPVVHSYDRLGVDPGEVIASEGKRRVLKDKISRTLKRFGGMVAVRLGIGPAMDAIDRYEYNVERKEQKTQRRNSKG
jgi:hypothetical protein